MLRWVLWFIFLPIAAPLFGIRRLRERLKPVTVLRLNLTGDLIDVPSAGPFASGSAALLPLLDALSVAARDPKLQTVLVRLEDFDAGLGAAEELRTALSTLAQSGKRVVVHADELGLGGLWVALGASEIVISPPGSLNVLGFGSEFTLLKGLFDKLGVDPQLVARGKYKSMREMFTEHEISDANREMISALLAELSGQLADRVAQSRDITPAQLETLLASAPFRAKAAKQAGLVDRVQYFDELLTPLKEDKGQRLAFGDSYLRMKRRRFLPHRPKRVALLTVGGNIKAGQSAAGRSGPRATGSTSFTKAVGAAVEDSKVKAIVLRVNSPGGSALASDLMWRALRKAQEKKPLFISMANVAASGGYYVSGLPGAKIWANPTTITGSIGVVGGKFSAHGLFEKLGIKKAAIKLSPRADFYSPSRAFNEEELAKLEEDIDASYEEFVQKMADGRNKSYAQMHEVAQGRVWTGSQAALHGLVDELGGMTELLVELRRSLGLKEDAEVRLVDYARSGFFRGLKERLRGGSVAAYVQDVFAESPELERLIGLADDFPKTRVFALMPFDLRFR